jgi:crossover junction endodeoxyribonuclease RusA
MKITLEGTPPSTSQIYKYCMRGNFISGYMTAQGKQKKEEYAWEMKIQYKGKLLEEEFNLEIDFYFPDKRRRDIDNFNKLIFDAGTEIIWKDDSLIKELKLRKFIDKTNPRVEITL